jgi:hypothetical protein
MRRLSARSTMLRQRHAIAGSPSLSQYREKPGHSLITPSPTAPPPKTGSRYSTSPAVVLSQLLMIYIIRLAIFFFPPGYRKITEDPIPDLVITAFLAESVAS